MKQKYAMTTFAASRRKPGQTFVNLRQGAQETVYHKPFVFPMGRPGEFTYNSQLGYIYKEGVKSIPKRWRNHLKFSELVILFLEILH